MSHVTKLLSASLAVAALACTAGSPVAPVEPASAATTTSPTYCDRDTYTDSVTKGTARKIAVTVVASACYRQVIANGRVLCSYLTSYSAFEQPQSRIDFLDRKVETEYFSWGKRGGDLTNGAGCLSAPSALLSSTQIWGGNYRYKNVGFDDHAQPRLRIVMQGSLVLGGAGEWAVQIARAPGGDWTF